MRSLSYVYDFYHGSTAVKLTVVARRAVAVTVVVGGAAYRTDIFDEVSVDGDQIRVGDAVFSPSQIHCELRLRGLKLSVEAQILTLTAFKRPLGLMCSWGLTEYSVSAPAVRASVLGRVTIGNSTFSDGDLVVVSSLSGSNGLRHTLVTGAQVDTGFYLAFGENATWGKTWQYVVACLAVAGRSHILTSASKLTRFCDGSDLFSVEASSPLLKISLAVKPDAECHDAGVRYCVSSVGDLTVQYGTKKEQYRMPMVYQHLGAARVSSEEYAEHATRIVTTEDGYRREQPTKK